MDPSRSKNFEFRCYDFMGEGGFVGNVAWAGEQGV